MVMLIASKPDLRGELHNARMRSALLAQDGAKGAARHLRSQRVSVTEACIRVAELRRVREIEELATKCEANVLVDGEGPLGCEVNAVLAGAANNANATVAEVFIGYGCAVGSLWCTREGGGIEVARFGDAIEERTAGLKSRVAWSELCASLAA